ncbi:DUF882 domain-containing protein [Geomonas sp. Red875]|uniref:Murein endopeptidase K n=2 Tax=Geomesophilobacter sediminis TaxID=2798584 RepID=A0A8J7S7I0_9BACT|nr:DUF882 domain-containing protein [Geomesophilobacter sediminis]
MLFAATLFTEKTAFARLPNLQGAPEGKLSLHNIHSNERLTVTYRNSLGEYDPEALKALNWLLRCHYTNQATKMDLRVIEYLNQVDKNLGGGNEIQIISGYRSPAYNSELRREGHGGVAKHSLHTKGKALDIAVPGVGLKTVRRTALALAYGGVGYYSQPGFVHIDSGNFRVWGR